MHTSWVDLLHWTLSCLLLSSESSVDCPCPWFHANSLCCPDANSSLLSNANCLSAVQRQLLSSGSVVNCLSAPLSSQLSFASPYHFRIRRDFRSKNPLSGFAPKLTKESSALAGYPYSATQETWVQSKVESYQRFKKIVPDTSLINTQHTGTYQVEQSRGRSIALPFTSV